MSLVYKIICNDLKLVFRDKSLGVMFIIPVAVTMLCRFGVPQIEAVFPSIKEYYWLIVASLTSLSASTPSFLMGFLLLDEKDENVDTLIRILPLPTNFILKSRVLLIVGFGMIFSLFILLLNNLVRLPLPYLFLLSFLFALIPPALTFAITAFAKNKIQAATMYKGLSIALFLPMVAFFFPGNLKFLLGVIPFFWTFNAFYLVGHPFLFGLNFGVSIVMHLLYIALFYQLYKKKAG